MGPLISERRRQAVEELVADARQAGAEVVAGGGRIGNTGNFLQPTVVTGVTRDMRIMNEEPFGPVALMMPFRDLDEAVAEANRLRLMLPPDVQAALLRHEVAGTTAHPEYEEATREFYRRHVCRLDPWPAEVTRTFEAMASDPTVYGTMNGPNEFHVIGTLRDWTVVKRLHRVVAPTLLLSGQHDEATPATVQPYADLIPDVRWTVFPDSSHMPHVEERRACMELVGGFLARYD